MCENHKRTYGIELEGYTDENIRGNHVQDWKLIDDGSLNDSSEECDNCCDGDYECSECWGNGSHECSDCNGGSEVPCGTCDCTGYVDCDECKGEGGHWINEGEEDEEWIDCNNCYDGKIDCDDCNSSGYVDCDTCNARGSIDCEDCDGSGRIECSECDGRGYYDSYDGEGYGVECVSGICEEGDFEPISQIFNYINRYKWKVDETCGTHVHIGGDDLQASDLSKLAILCNIVEPMIYGTLSRHRFYTNYCKKTKRDMVEYLIPKGDTITLQELADKYYGYSVNINGSFSKYQSERYYGLNLHSWFYRKTIEFRYFDGTESEEQSKGWIDLCIKLVDFAKHTSFEQLQVIGKEFHSVDSLEELIAKVKTLLGLEYNFTPYNNGIYAESKGNIASQLRRTHIITRAV